MSGLRVDSGSQSLLWGVGLFETMLVVRGRVMFEQQHYDRMVAAARELEIPEPSGTAWASAVEQALRKEERDDERALRCSWVDVGAHDGAGDWAVLASSFEVPPVTRSRRLNGRVALLPPALRRTMPGVKSLSHLASVVGLRQARDAGADEGLFTTAGGRTLEGTSTNVFAMNGETLVTPPLDAGILPGIVRAWVIENAPRVGLLVEERLPDRDDLLRGSFLTSSLTCLAPIRSVDGAPAREPGERFEQLVRLFGEDVRG